jgi:hypothetical protein
MGFCVCQLKFDSFQKELSGRCFAGRTGAFPCFVIDKRGMSLLSGGWQDIIKSGVLFSFAREEEIR